MRITSLILYTALKLIKTIIEISPLKAVLCLGKVLGILGYTFLPKRKKITVENLARAFPDKSRTWCYITARKVFANFGKNMMEFIKFASGKLNHMVEADGIEKFDEGVVLMTGHLGNWEITGMSVAISGRELYPIGRRIHEPAFDKIVDDLRTTYGSYHIPYRGSIKEILRKIKNHKNLCVLIDQRMSSGIPCLFFNRPVWCTHIVSVLYRKTGVKIIPSYSRHDNGKIKVYYEDPLCLVNDKDSIKSDFINTQKQLRWMEDRIREKPDEWFWMHNFWKDKWPAVFLDRDGTINIDHGYVSKKENFEFIPGVFEAMRKLRKAGYLLIIVTNQSGIARGYYTERDYNELNKYFMGKLESEGVIVDRVYHCSHHPDDDCEYRKPKPGMVHRASEELNIDLGKSFVVGDKVSDIELGKNLGMKNIMVMTGYGREQIHMCDPDFKAENLLEASEVIITHSLQ